MTNPSQPRIELLRNVDEDDDSFTPYVNAKVLVGIMAHLPPSVLEGMKTAAFLRMMHIVLRLFRIFAAKEVKTYPLLKKEMYVYGGYIRRSIILKADATRAIAAFEQTHGPLDQYFNCDEDHNPTLWCSNIFVDPAMDIDFHFGDIDQNERFIEYLREFFCVVLLPNPDNEYPSRQKLRSFHITSRMLDPMSIRLKIDVSTPVEDIPMFPDFTANQLRQTPGGSTYIGNSIYFNFESGFAPPDHVTLRCDTDPNTAILTRTMVELENGITRLLLVPIDWFKTKDAATYVRSLSPTCEHKQGTELVEHAYNVYLRHVFSRLRKTIGFKVVNFEVSVQYRDGCHYFVPCCQWNHPIDSESVGQHHGNIVVLCKHCAKKIVVFTNFMHML